MCQGVDCGGSSSAREEGQMNSPRESFALVDWWWLEETMLLFRVELFAQV